mgnify:FL=1
MLVALLGLVACSDNAEDVSESSEANVSMKNISVTAQVPGANTYGALKAFSLSDVLHVTFQTSDGTQTGRTQTLRCAESTGSTATFSAQRVAVPNDAANMLLTWDNPACKINWDGKPVVVEEFGTQAGTEEWVRQHSVISATTAVGESANVTLAYQTAVVKIDVQFPTDADEPTVANTRLTLSGLINKLVMDNGKALTAGEGVTSTTGDVVVAPAVIDAAARKVTAYAVVWPQASYDGVTLAATIDNANFSGVFRLGAVKPGEDNTVVSMVDFNSREYDL